MLKIGLVVNPVAGVGGAVGLKGSDGAGIQALALQRGGQPRTPERTLRTLQAIGDDLDRIEWFTWGGNMGSDYLESLGISCREVGGPSGVTSAVDTREAAVALRNCNVDLLLFSGGDGTARDLYDAIEDTVVVVGIPGGVKMHSGVFATTPEAAGELIRRLLAGGLVNSVLREVRDLDEEALRQGRLQPRYFGELRVPEPGGFLQRTKDSGVENEALAVAEIAAEIVERIGELDCAVVLGPGSTVAEVKRSLGMTPTLLGFDVWQSSTQIASDVDGAWLEQHMQRCVLVLSFTRGQGFLLGRGNQQLTPGFLRNLDAGAIWVAGTRTKLKSLHGQPLLLDTDDPDLDRRLSGLIEIVAGYDDRLLYRISSRITDA